MKAIHSNYKAKTYDIYSATYKFSEDGKLIIDSKWKFSDTLNFQNWEDVWKNNFFIIQDDYFMCTKGTVFLFAEYNTKTYINLQKLYDNYRNERLEFYKRKYKSCPQIGHNHYKHYRKPHTTHSLKNIVSKEERREYKENYPNIKLSLKNSRIKNLPTSWDDIPRQYSRSWKDCTKKKHRYE